MVHFGETVKKVLQKRFPNAKVEYNLDGYWDVIYDAGIGTVIDSFKLEKGKLINFATIEIED